MGLRVSQGFFLAPGCFRLRKRLQEGFYLFLIRVINILQRTAGLGQSVAHAVDMSVIQPYGRKHELSRLHHRLGFSLRCVVHSV